MSHSINIVKMIYTCSSTGSNINTAVMWRSIASDNKPDTDTCSHMINMHFLNKERIDVIEENGW